MARRKALQQQNQGKNCQRQRHQQAGKYGERSHWALGQKALRQGARAAGSKEMEAGGRDG